MEIFRIIARWTGFTGAPGYSAFHFAGGGGLVSDAQQCADRVSAAFTAVREELPSGVRVQVVGEVERIDSDSGEVLGFENVESLPVLGNSTAGGWSAASGAVVNWRTNDLRNGRRIRGRTFLVPLGGTAYQNDGTLSTGGLSAVNAFANEMTGTDFDSELGVWSRPLTGSGGVFASVSGFSVPDKAAVLRSRRD